MAQDGWLVWHAAVPPFTLGFHHGPRVLSYCVCNFDQVRDVLAAGWHSEHCEFSDNNVTVTARPPVETEKLLKRLAHGMRVQEHVALVSGQGENGSIS